MGRQDAADAQAIKHRFEVITPMSSPSTPAEFGLPQANSAHTPPEPITIVTLPTASATASASEFAPRSGTLTGASATAGAGEFAPAAGERGQDGGVMLDDGTVVYPEPPAEPSAGASSGDFSPLDFAAADFRQQSPAPPSPVTDLKIELNDAPAQSDSTPVPQTVALEARSQTHLAGSGGLSVEGFPAGLTVKRAKGRRSARTVVGRSVLKNTVKIEETGAVFIALLEGAIEELQRKRPNSDEGKAAVKNEIAECEDLKRRVEAFLATASQFSAEKAKETSVVKTTLSLQEGIADWWTKDHREICDLTFRFGLFGAGLGLCVLAGAGGPLSALIPGAMFGGKPVVEAIKAWRKGGHS